MFAPIGNYIADRVSGAVTRAVTISGFYVLGAILLICAAGYGVDALHSHLALSKGAITASLWIVGGLVIVAIIFAGIGYYLGKKPRSSPPLPWAETALLSAPTMVKLSNSPRIAQLAGSVRANWKVAAIGAGLSLCVLAGRRLMQSDREMD